MCLSFWWARNYSVPKKKIGFCAPVSSLSSLVARAKKTSMNLHSCLAHGIGSLPSCVRSRCRGSCCPLTSCVAWKPGQNESLAKNVSCTNQKQKRRIVYSNVFLQSFGFACRTMMYILSLYLPSCVVLPLLCVCIYIHYCSSLCCFRVLVIAVRWLLMSCVRFFHGSL